MKRVYIRELKIGDVISVNIVGRHGRTVIAKGASVSKSTIETLKRNNVIYVPIEDNNESDFCLEKIKKEITGIIQTHREYLSETKEYKEFKENYIRATDNASKKFKAIKNGYLSNTSELAEDIIRILYKSGNNVDLLNYVAMAKDISESLYDHSVSTSISSYLLAKWCRYSELEAGIAAISGLFHDIGKLNVPEKILNKVDPLTIEEEQLIKTHPFEGFMMLKKSSLHSDIKRAVLQHHEQIDKNGYPMSLGIGEISNYAQIVGLAGRFDFDTRKTPYKEAMTPFEAIGMLDEEWFSICNGNIALTFLDRISESYVGNTVLLSNGQRGTIVFINNRDRSHPLVQLSDGSVINPYENSLEIVRIL